ncbi:MAG: 4-hydroxy-3-methylbut-2-enyl diphosphate reductase [Victivallales bacterium]|nr:4-hydroxy-3-methylbut-2-enyl diphosphate reductase [Victivallales bacterium]
MTKILHIARPIGFCNGVKHAMKLFEDLVQANSGKTIYVRHELVHNHAVTQAMKDKGAIFVQDVEQVPKGATVLIGAHGCGPSVLESCSKRHLDVHDATCPRVVRLRNAMASCDHELPIVLLGDYTHPEVYGIADYLIKQKHDVYIIRNCHEAECLPLMDSAAFFSQTTRCITEIAAVRSILARRIRRIDDHAHPCPAVQDRQMAMKSVAKCCELVIIVGSSHSSNAQRLAEIAKESGCSDVCFVESANDIIPTVLAPIEHLGIGAATSSPDDIIHSIISKILQLGFTPADE